jgi:DHA3 family macrolide efflux protein-like MFS transporter
VTSIPDEAATLTDSPVVDPTASVGAVEKPGWRRDTSIFLTSQTISLFGSSLVQYAIVWYLTLQTKSGSVMALAAVFGYLPQAVVSIFGGVWADRLNRKMLIIGADAMIATATLALALAMLAGAQDRRLIYVALAIRSVGAGIQMPAVNALIPQIVPTGKLIRVNSINTTIQAAMLLIAPAAAAAVYASSSIIAVFFVDIVTAVIGIGLLSLIKVPRLVRSRRAGDEHAGYFDELVSGLRYAASQTFVRWVLVFFAVVFLLICAPSYLMPLMIVRTFGPEVWKLTTLEVAFSIGMIIGGALLAIRGGLRNRVAMIVASTVVLGGLSIGLGLSTNLWVFFGFYFLVGITVPSLSTTAVTVLQETVAPQMQGRVFGLIGIVMAVSMPVGMMVCGPLADRFTVQAVLVVTGAVTLIACPLALALPSGRQAMHAAHQPSADSDSADSLTE